MLALLRGNNFSLEMLEKIAIGFERGAQVLFCESTFDRANS